jgi:transposase-like protein
MGILNHEFLMKCPSCASEDLHRSRSPGIFEKMLLRVLGRFAYRCDECDERSYLQRPNTTAAATEVGSTD